MLVDNRSLMTERPTLWAISNTSKRIPDEDIYVDANGWLRERATTGDLDVILVCNDIPESDITTINGLRCTIALRTVIDLAPGLETAELKRYLPRLPRSEVVQSRGGNGARRHQRMNG